MNLPKNAPLQGGRYAIERVTGQGGPGAICLAMTQGTPPPPPPPMSGRPVPPRPVPPVGKPKKEKRPLSPEEKRRRARRLRRWLFIAIGVCLLPVVIGGIVELRERQRMKAEEAEAARIEAEKESHVARPVDLGLSVKWASWDMGASAPEENGLYYGWGGTVANQGYEASAYEGNSIAGTRYDVARASWGAHWRIPTYNECEELVVKCTWRQERLNGIDGVRAYGPNGNSIFFPFKTYSFDSGSTDYWIDYWTANVCNGKEKAWSFYGSYDDKDTDAPSLSKTDRSLCLAIRPVYVD